MTQYQYDPQIGENGLMVGEADWPLTHPVEYVPCKGELGVVINDVFQPLFPAPFRINYFHIDTMALTCIEPVPMNIPWVDQTGIAVAQPIVFPYNWANISLGWPIMILDTEPDATASAADKALPNYYPNPGLTIRSKTHYDFDLDNYNDEYGVGYYWTWNSSNAKPVTRTSGAVGTKYEGVPFIPAAPGTFVGEYNGRINVCAYHHYMTITNYSYYIQVKIGRGTALWDAAAKTLNLSTPTTSPTIKYVKIDKIHAVWDGVDKLSFSCQKSGTVIKYSLDGSAPTLTYSTPLTIVATTKVRVQTTLSPAYLAASNVYTFDITFTGVTPPGAFENLYTWAALEALGASSSAFALNAFTNYSVPLSLTETTKIRWYINKSYMVKSDFWDTTVTYSGATPPAIFETVYFSTLPAYDSTESEIALTFQRRPDWYVSPAGVGDGLTPGTPGSMASIVGLNTAAGKAYGWRGVYFGKSGANGFYLSPQGTYSPATLKYSFDKVTWTTYVSTVASVPSPGYLYAKFVRNSDGTDYTRIFVQPWFLGTGVGVQVRAIWSLSAKTLTLTYEAPTEVTAGSFVTGVNYRITAVGTTDFTLIGAASNTVGVWFIATGAGLGTGTASMIEAAAAYIQYSLDTNVPNVTYTSAVTITETCTPLMRMQHPKRDPHDFSAVTNTVTLPAIDPNATADFNNTYAITFSSGLTDWQPEHRQGPDIVWCSEGTYSNPSGTYAQYFQANGDVPVFGGYSSDFTRRDVMNRKSIIAAVGWNDSTTTADTNHYNIVTSYIDGFWGETAVVCRTITDSYARYRAYRSAWLFPTGISNNCHVIYSGSFTGAEGGQSSLPENVTIDYRAWPADAGGAKCVNCTADIDVTVSAGAIATGTHGGRACNGGTSNTRIVVANYSGYTQQNCTFDINVTIGDASDGAAYPGGTGIGGRGGGITGRIDLGAGLQCDVNALLTMGRGGDGGYGYGDVGSYDSANSGGTTTGGIYANTTVSGVTSVNCTTGRGGDGGDCPLVGGSYPSTGGNGGGANSTVANNVDGRDNTVVIVSACGKGGDGGAGRSSNYQSSHGGSSYARADCSFSSALDSDMTVTCDAGDGGTRGAAFANDGYSYAWLNSGAGGVRNTLAGHAICGVIGRELRSYLYFSYSPCYFEAGAFTFTESPAPYGNGNPIRVDVATGGTIGWYSGLPNGNGAPLPGYTIPQGSGIALGRYWD